MLHAIQYNVIDRMARGLSIRGAATAAGVSERSVRRWRDNPEFAAELRDAIASVREEVSMALNAQAKTAMWVADRALERLDVLTHHRDVDTCMRATQIALNYNFKLSLAVVKTEPCAVAPATGGVTLPATLDDKDIPGKEPAACGQNRTEADTTVPRAAEVPAPSTPPSTCESAAPAAATTLVSCPCDRAGDAVEPATESVAIAIPVTQSTASQEASASAHGQHGAAARGTTAPCGQNRTEADTTVPRAAEVPAPSTPPSTCESAASSAATTHVSCPCDRAGDAVEPATESVAAAIPVAQSTASQESSASAHGQHGAAARGATAACGQKRTEADTTVPRAAEVPAPSTPPSTCESAAPAAATTLVSCPCDRAGDAVEPATESVATAIPVTQSTASQEASASAHGQHGAAARGTTAACGQKRTEADTQSIPDARTPLPVNGEGLGVGSSSGQTVSVPNAPLGNVLATESVATAIPVTQSTASQESSASAHGQHGAAARGTTAACGQNRTEADTAA